MAVSVSQLSGAAASLRQINRAAILVRPKEPFINWLRSVAHYEDLPDGEFEDFVQFVSRRMGPYLISKEDTEQAGDRVVKRYFEQIFKNELTKVYWERHNWPDVTSYDVFREWFSVTTVDRVLDFSDSAFTRKKTKAFF